MCLTLSFLGFPCGSAGKEPACNAGNLGLIPGLGRSPGEGKCYPLQYSDLENSMDCIVHGVSKVRHDWATFTLLHFSIRFTVKLSVWQEGMCLNDLEKFIFKVPSNIIEDSHVSTLLSRASSLYWYAQDKTPQRHRTLMIPHLLKTVSGPLTQCSYSQ